MQDAQARYNLLAYIAEDISFRSRTDISVQLAAAATKGMQYG